MSLVLPVQVGAESFPRFLFRKMRPRSYNDGFALIEIMIVVAIMGALATLAIPNYLGYRAQSQRQTCIANMKAIIVAEESFCLANGRYANSIDELCSTDLESRFLKTKPICPCGGTYKYFEPTDSSPSLITCTGGSYKEGYEHSLSATDTDFKGQ